MMHRTILLLLPALLAPPVAAAPDAIDIGSRRELFVDHLLIERLDGASLKLHEPRSAGPRRTV